MNFFPLLNGGLDRYKELPGIEGANVFFSTAFLIIFFLLALAVIFTNLPTREEKRQGISSETRQNMKAAFFLLGLCAFLFIFGAYLFQILGALVTLGAAILIFRGAQVLLTQVPPTEEELFEPVESPASGSNESEYFHLRDESELKLKQ